jgi:hypothetical protein
MSAPGKVEMTSTRPLALAAALLGLCAIAVGLVTSHAARLALPRADGASAGEARAAVHAELERLESALPAGRAGEDGLWRTYLEVFEKERAQGHLGVAIRVVYDAYGAALESRSWESMIAVGDAFMAIGREPGNAAGARMNARQAYLTALIRARRGRSVEGALRSAEAFRGLHDGDVVDQCLHVAAVLAAGDEDAEQRVREARLRWAARQPLAEF